MTKALETAHVCCYLLHTYRHTPNYIHYVRTRLGTLLCATQYNLLWVFYLNLRDYFFNPSDTNIYIKALMWLFEQSIKFVLITFMGEY